MENFAAREQKVINFMDKVREAKEQEARDNAFQNSTDYKLRCLDREHDKAKDVCLDMIFSSIYKNALPLNNDYKVAHADDLDAEMKDFINARSPKGMVYYVKEGIRKGSTAAKKIMDATDKITQDDYNNKAMNVENLSADDMMFRANDETVKKIDAVSNDMDLPDLSQAIKDNVKMAAMSEIKRAKEEKENIRNLEKQLSQDMSVTTNTAIESALELHGITEKKNFNPTLFQGIMIGNVNKYQALKESGLLKPQCVYGTLDEFGFTESVEATDSVEVIAFIESVKEFTKLSIIKALKLERFDPRTITEMANDYAMN